MKKAQLQISQETGVIECNFEEVKKSLQDYLSEYTDAFFTEESKSYAKSIVAGLRKEKKEATERIKAVKTAYMQPYNEFEQQAKILLELYDEPIKLIDSQVKAFDEDRKEQKRGLIRDLYNECVGELEEYIPLTKIYNPKWENTTTTKKSIKEDLMYIASGVRKAVDTITNMRSESTDKALAIYKNNLSLTDAITYINNYESQKAEIEKRNQERIRQEETERIRREEREKIEAENRMKAEKEAAIRKAEEEKIAAMRKAEEEKEIAIEQAKQVAAQEVFNSLIPLDLDTEANLYEYRMSLTADAKQKVEMYLDSIGVDWEMI